MNPVLEAITTRRSVREFTEQPVEEETIKTLLEAARWAPSGLNNQPWRFIVIRKPETIQALSQLTKYSKVVSGAPLLIAVFLDHREVYHHLKDAQAVGAAIENLLLAAHSLKLGAVWLGEILNRSEDVKTLLAAPEEWELMAVVAAGHPVEKNRVSTRRKLSEIAFCEDVNTPFQ
jgi:nitroreductase